MEWEHTSSPRTKNFRSVPSAGKVILTLFSEFNGPISNTTRTVDRSIVDETVLELKPLFTINVEEF
jgi:hypothetical protein